MCGHRVFVTVLLWIMGMLNESFGEQLLLTTIDRCGEAPGIDNGDVVERSRVQLKYQCRSGYNLHGEDTVLCFSNSSWSELPRCKGQETPITTIDRCGAAPPVVNGDIVEHSQALLKYQCRPGYKFYGEDTLLCLSNGSWSELPFCIEDTACIEPKIANANNTKFLFVRNNDKIWIRCNAGYEDRKRRATALCKNGQWTELPVCEKMVTSCGPPPSIPNGTIVNQVHKDVFPEGTRVEYVCENGFEPETSSNETICIYGEWFPAPSCGQKERNEEHVPLTPGSGSDDNFQSIFTTIDKCGAAPVVEEGVAFYDKDNMFIIYRCPHLYKLKGSSTVRCSDGRWTSLPTCEADFCKLDTSKHPEVVQAGDVYIKSGTEVKLRCFDMSHSKTAYAECRDDQLYLSKCCGIWRHKLGLCDYVQISSSQ